MPRSRIARVLALACSLTLAICASHAEGSLRLGRDVLPREESLELKLDPREARYSGVVRLEFEVPAPVDSFRLHALELSLEKVTLRGPAGEVAVRYDARADGIVLVRTSRPLTPGAYTLEIKFSNDFDTRALALYRVTTAGRSYTYSQFEAIEARRAFPCWDEPAIKIPWQIALRVPVSDLAVSNTPSVSERVEGDWKTVTFERTAPLPAYLIAIATGPLDSRPIPGLPVPGRIVSTRGTAPLTGDAAAMAPPLLAELERYFGRPFPYPKLDLIAVPEFAYGAMENAGAIVFVDRALLMDPKAVSPELRKQVAGIIAHEMAHQWYGDLVTMRWWDDLWLNESFASWMGDHVTALAFPRMRMAADELPGRERAFALDALEATHAMRRPVGDDVNLDQLADALAYRKGQALLLMFEQWLGPDTFRAGVREYMRTYAWGDAVGSDLWNTLSVVSGRDVAGPMASFLDQAGVPLVSLERTDPTHVRLTQQRFFTRGARPEASERWRIPVVLKSWDGKRARLQRVMLDQPSQTFALEGGESAQWVHPNADESGYYRWSVPASMLERMAASPTGALTLRERTELTQQARALLGAGMLDGGLLVRLIERGARDPEPEPVAAALRAAVDVRKSFIAPEDDALYADWLQRTFRPALDRIGLTRRASELDPTAALRAGLIGELGLYGGDAALRAEAVRQTDRWLVTPTSVDASLAQRWLSIAARDADPARFDAYRKRFEAATVPQDRQTLLEALSHARRPETMTAALAWSLNGPLRPQEVCTIARGFDDAPPARQIAREWVRAEYDSIVARIPRSDLIDLVRIGEDCSTGHLEETRQFFSTPARNTSGIPRELTELDERSGDCEALRQRSGPAVRAAMTPARP